MLYYCAVLCCCTVQYCAALYLFCYSAVYCALCCSVHFLSSGISQLRCDSGRSSHTQGRYCTTASFHRKRARRRHSLHSIQKNGLPKQKTVLYCNVLSVYGTVLYAIICRGFSNTEPSVCTWQPPRIRFWTEQPRTRRVLYCTALYYTVLYSSWQPHRHEGSVHPVFSLKPGHAQGSTPQLSPLSELPSAKSS